MSIAIGHQTQRFFSSPIAFRPFAMALDENIFNWFKNLSFSGLITAALWCILLLRASFTGQDLSYDEVLNASLSSLHREIGIRVTRHTGRTPPRRARASESIANEFKFKKSHTSTSEGWALRAHEWQWRLGLDEISSLIRATMPNNICKIFWCQ